MKKTLFILLTIIAITACKEDESQTQELGTLNLTFENVVDGAPLKLGDSYSNKSLETYTVSELKYIVSNITLTRKDGTLLIYPQDQSYFLINEAEPSSQNIQLEGIEAGDYTAVTFGFGVDPTKYPIESGTLNFIPTAEEGGMLWTWSAGYKFIKLEGDYTTQNATEEASFIVHVGSHGANLDNYKEVTVPLNNNGYLTIEEKVNTSKTIFFDMGQVFDGANSISIDNKPDIQVDPINAPRIADNISAAFYVSQ